MYFAIKYATLAETTSGCVHSAQDAALSSVSSHLLFRLSLLLAQSMVTKRRIAEEVT